MFSLRTVKGRLASAAVVVLALGMAACVAVVVDEDADGYWVDGDGVYVTADGDPVDDGTAVRASDGTIVFLDTGCPIDGCEDVAFDCEADDVTCVDTCEPDDLTCGVDPDPDVDPDAIATIAGSGFNACHTQQTTGGASDGVLTIALEDVPVGTPLTAVVSVRGGQQDVTLTAVVGDGGAAVFLVPLTSIGEVVTIVSISTETAELDLTGLEGLSYTVESDSDCTGHPSDQ